MDDAIQRLRQQSDEHYRAEKDLRELMQKITAALFGNGNPDGSLVRRLKRLEDDMGEFHDWIVQEEAARSERQAQIDKRDQAHDRKLNLLMAIVAVVGLLMPIATVAIGKLL